LPSDSNDALEASAVPVTQGGRITSKFRTTISAQNARRLARLLALDGDGTRKE